MRCHIQLFTQIWRRRTRRWLRSRRRSRGFNSAERGGIKEWVGGGGGEQVDT